MKNVKLPTRFLGDLVKDLRDRRLLPVAAGLLLATVMVPVVLSSSPAPPADSQGAQPSSAGRVAELALETQPVVAADVPGLRDYRRRLRAFRAKNPFKQQGAPSVAKLLKDLDKAVNASLKDAKGATGGVPGAPGPPSPSVPGAGGGDQRFRVFRHRIDIRFGEAGETKLRRNVKALTLLPSDALPIVSFLGVTEDEKSGVFLVSTEAASEGEGECSPSPETCQFLKLGEGQTHFLKFGEGTDDEVTYELKLVRIKRVQTKQEQGDGNIEQEEAPAQGEQPPPPPADQDPETGEGEGGGESPGGDGGRSGDDGAGTSNRSTSDGLGAWLKLGF